MVEEEKERRGEELAELRRRLETAERDAGEAAAGEREARAGLADREAEVRALQEELLGRGREAAEERDRGRGRRSSWRRRGRPGYLFHVTEL